MNRSWKCSFPIERNDGRKWPRSKLKWSTVTALNKWAWTTRERECAPAYCLAMMSQSMRSISVWQFFLVFTMERGKHETSLIGHQTVCRFFFYLVNREKNVFFVLRSLQCYITDNDIGSREIGKEKYRIHLILFSQLFLLSIFVCTKTAIVLINNTELF